MASVDKKSDFQSVAWAGLAPGWAVPLDQRAGTSADDNPPSSLHICFKKSSLFPEIVLILYMLIFYKSQDTCPQPQAGELRLGELW